jgi:hypothetical protein
MAIRYKIGSAPNGEKATLAGTEKFPLDGGQYALVSSISTYQNTIANSYPIAASFASSNPADATTYYFGAFPHVALGTTPAINRLYFLRAGTVVAATVSMYCTSGTTEQSTLSFRLNDTTDTTITSTWQLSTAFFVAENTALSITVARGDYFEIKWLTPTWATNPTGVTGRVDIFVR